MPSAGKLATNKFDEVVIRGKRFSMLEVLQRLDALPPMAPLSTQEAAFFLGYSPSQMERMRVNGNGPRYRQNPPEPGSKATNTHVTYKKADLIEWDKANTLSSSMEFAVKHGLAAMTLADCAREAAFYVDESGAIESLAESNTLGTVIDRLGTWNIQWLPVIEACGRPWSDVGRLRELAAQVSSALTHAQGLVAAGIEQSEFRQIANEANKAARERGEG